MLRSLLFLFLVSVSFSVHAKPSCGMNNEPKSCSEIENSFRASLSPVENSAPLVFTATLSDTINPATAEFIIQGIERAEREKADAFILTLDTPGGLVTATQKIVQKMLAATVPVIVYVGPSGGGAISAGVFITMAAHVAVMAPGTSIGAAHPVSGGGKDMEEDMRKKTENFVASLAKSIAEQRGRNIEWAEKAVRESVTLTDSEAVKQNVVDFMAEDFDALLKSLTGRSVKLGEKESVLSNLVGVSPQKLEMSFQQMVVSGLSNPNIMALLGLAAMGGLAAEFYNPGLIIPGLIGVISLILVLVASQVIPINVGGMLLLLLGVALISLEAFVPSFGILGIAGLVALVLGAIYAVDTSDIWATEGVLELNEVLVGSVAAFIGLLLMGLVYVAVASRRSRVQTGRMGMIGKEAVVCQDFIASALKDGVYEGKVSVMGEIWKASISSNKHSDFEKELVVGVPLIVSGVEGLTLQMKKPE